MNILNEDLMATLVAIHNEIAEKDLDVTTTCMYDCECTGACNPH